jgi:anti-anti-sigma factor
MQATMSPEIGGRLEHVRRLFRGPANEAWPIAPKSSPRTSIELSPLSPKPPPRLAVALLEAGDEVIVMLGGEAGIAEVGTLEDSLLPLSTWSPKSVTFDLTELRFISSLALSVLVDFQQAEFRRGVTVRLASDIQPNVRELLRITGVLELFSHVDDLNDSSSASLLIHGAGI